MWATSAIKKNIQSKHHPLGETSPTMVTLGEND
jgi:hypothetical protein